MNPPPRQVRVSVPAAGPAPALALLATAVLVHDRAAQRVLMLRRGPDAPFGADLWDVPAGKCDDGEPITAAAVRELAEETGVRVAAGDLRLAHVVHARAPRAGQPVVTVVFVAERWSGQAAVREPEKHSAVEWISLNALPADCVLNADQTIAACLTRPPEVTEHGWD